MLFMNFSLNQYFLIIGITFFIIVLDNIFTNINSRLYNEYYKLEILPWNKLIYRKSTPLVAIILSFIVNLGILFVMFLLPIKITWIVVFSGFWIYRLWHSIIRLWYIKSWGN